MSEPHRNEVIVVHLEYIREKQDEIVAHLATLNGRVGSSETRLTVLETRADDAKQQGAKYGGLIGGAIAAASALWQMVRQ